MRRAGIKAVRSFLPTRTVTNDHLSADFGEEYGRQILDKVGIATRHVATEQEFSSDLGYYAAERLFDDAVASRGDIDFLIFCTQSPDYFLPTTACLVHERLGLNDSCGAIDINQGCSGYIYGLALANSLINSGLAANVLLITADTYSKFINQRDRSLRALFGDGATATLLTAVDTDRNLIGPFVLGTDGRGADKLIVKAGALRFRRCTKTAAANAGAQEYWRCDENLYMDGAAILNFALREVPRALNDLLLKSGLTLEEIDLVIPHQANRFMLERLRSRLKVPADKFWIDMEECGNTVSCTIPIALERALACGRISKRDRVALIGFGVGFSWGATIAQVM